jgi:hypothetical protein
MQITKSDYLAEMDGELKKVRDALLGSPFIKREGEKYLVNPELAPDGKLNAEAREIKRKAYENFKLEAEFDDYPSLTERVMIGKLNLSDAAIDMPDKLEYLRASADGDGLSLTGLLENSVQNVLAAKWHILVVDYTAIGMTSLDTGSISMADLEAANPRAVIKEYPRESVYKAHYSVINGIKQLSLLALREVGSVIDPVTMEESEIESFLILGLTDEGYFQRKITQSKDGAMEDTSNKPVLINGQSIPFIPAYVLSDEELTTGQLPRQLGFLSPIVDLCMARYNVSAKFKSALTKFVPTTYISGLTQDSYKATCSMNGGALRTNGVVVLASDDNGNAPTVDVKSSSGQLADFHAYFEESLERLRSLGAAVPDDNNKSTATKAKIDAGQQNAVLNPIVDNLEKMLKQVLSYAAMFEGLVPPDNIESFESQLSITLKRDFSSIKGTPEEMGMLVNLYATGLRTKEQVIYMTHALGYDTKEAEELLREIEAEPERQLV